MQRSKTKTYIEKEAAAKLLAIATLKGEMLMRTTQELETLMTYPISPVKGDIEVLEPYETWWLTLINRMPYLQGAVVTDSAHNILWSTGECQPESPILPHVAQGTTH